MSKEGYIPLSEVYSQSIKSNLILPFHLEEQIGLNVKKAAWLAQLGGLRSVSIKNDPKGETSKAQGTVVGMNGDGSAIAGAQKVDYVPTSAMEIKSDKKKWHSARWADVSITVNSDEIKERLLHGNKVVSKPLSWAPEIDMVIKKEMRKAGNKQLLGISGIDKFCFYSVYGISSFFVLDSAGVNPSIEAIALQAIGAYIQTGLIWNVLDKLQYGSEKLGFGARTTLGIGPELDRAVVFNLSFLGKPLIKDLTK